jgi:hypothetical protein
MKRLVVAAFAVLVAFGITSSAFAAEKTIIQYALGGQVDVVIPTSFSSPVFSPLAPGPGGTGSTVTFQFDSSASHPILSGNVTILTFVQSNGITIPGLLVGYNRFSLTQPGGITGGHLLPGSIATGAGLALGQPNGGYAHCIASPAACYALLAIPTFYQSFQLPRATTTPIPFGGPTPFPIPHTSTAVPPPSQTLGGWFFQPSLFGSVLGIRPFCTAFTGAPGASLCSGAEGIITLVGTEIYRTKVQTPEPAVLPLVALTVLGAGGAAVWSRRRKA